MKTILSSFRFFRINFQLLLFSHGGQQKSKSALDKKKKKIRNFFPLPQFVHGEILFERLKYESEIGATATNPNLIPNRIGWTTF